MEDYPFSEKGFNATISGCIDRALSTIGESAKAALYYRIATKASVSPSEIQFRPLELTGGMREILGEAGYSFIERLIIREISSSFNLSLRGGICFSEAVSEARKKFLE